MKVFLRASAVVMSLLVGVSGLRADDDISPAVKEVTEAFHREAEAIDLDATAELAKIRAQTAERLQTIQDRLCREAKLDEAVAVRDRIRVINGKSPPCPTPASVETALPADAHEISQTHDLVVAAHEKKTVERIVEAGRKAAAPLERKMKELCREEKLDEALTLRNVIRQMTSVVREVLPDPGYLAQHGTQDIDKVFYFEVVGSVSGSLYGTDIYTNDSALATAAVHSGALSVGEKGIVKVTVLPGRQEYESSTRCGITSNRYGPWSLSYKIERARGVVKLMAKPQ